MVLLSDYLVVFAYLQSKAGFVLYVMLEMRALWARRV